MAEFLICLDDEKVFQPRPQATRLAVVLHGYNLTSEAMADVIRAVEEAYGKQNVDIFSPTLPYSDPFDFLGAEESVLSVVAGLDEIWDRKPGGYKNIVFIGHSLGGILLRRVFLAGSLNPPDYDGEFKLRDELYGKIAERRQAKGLPADKVFPCEWAPKVRRLILLATWDKGWSVSPRTSWYYGIALNALGAVGRLLELFRIRGSDEEPRATGAVSVSPPSNEGSLWRRLAAVVKAQPARTMLDMRQGAPFIVQTRLLWMAYRRWHNPDFREKYNQHGVGVELGDPEKLKRDGEALTSNPLIIQIIGSKDDFVSPQEQVDLDAEGVRSRLSASKLGNEGPPEANYFLLEMRDADHYGVVKYSGGVTSAEESLLAKRKALFISALRSDAAEMASAPPTSDLGSALRNPVDFFDAPPEIDQDVEDVVFVMHGIRDDGSWTHRVAAAIKEEWARHRQEEKEPAEAQTAEKKVKFYPSWTHSYGYFPMLPFILPWIRRGKVEWFMDQYVNVKARYPAARLHYVGHSNGTYIGATALHHYPAARFSKVYFAGSVVHPHYDWTNIDEKKKALSFHNARGGQDWVVALLPKSIVLDAVE